MMLYIIGRRDPATWQAPRAMVISAALLIRERGAHSTAISDVLEHSGAPRGSAYHYFPGGRTQLLCEAVDFAAEYIAAPDRQAPTAASTRSTVIVDGFRKQLVESDFRAGCPVVAVAVEADNQPRHRAGRGGVRPLDRPHRRATCRPTASPPTAQRNSRCCS